MTRRALLALSIFLLLVPVAFAKPKPKTHHIVVALTSGDQADWQMTVGNVTHLAEGLAPESVEIEVVAYGGGITFVTNASTMKDEIAKLQADHHVRFVACQNSMRAHHLEQKDLLPGVTPVPSGIVEVVTKQEQGWTYIKAGK